MSQDYPLISVVIPTHNRAALLPRAVHSVLGQSYPHFEIIIVDDASSDDSESTVAALNDQRIRYLRHTTNRGGSAARNTGIKAAKGKFVAFLDDDDEWLPEKLTRQLQVAFKSDDAGQTVVVYTGLQYINSDGQIVCTIRPKKQGEILFDLLYGNYIGSTSSVFVSKQALLASGGFDESLESCQDWDLLIRLALTCSYIAIAEPLVKHYTHGKRIDTNLSAQLQGRLRLLEKIKPNLVSMSWWQRRRILANHYLMLAGHYASHRKKIEAIKWTIRSSTQNPLNWRSWLLFAKNVATN